MKYTSHILLSCCRRFCVALAVSLGMLAAAPAAHALDAWQAKDAVKPLGSGTEADPYVIASGANLFWLSLNMGKESLADKWFVQSGDIDLEDRDWTPIGGVTVGTFKGHYDGRGHTITGLRIDWSQLPRIATATGTLGRQSSTSTAAVYGLFGRLGGNVSNLVIDGAKIIQEPRDAELTVENDATIGVLAGAIGDASLSITNVIIRNAVIKDSGQDDARLISPGYLIGGLIGDLHGDQITNYTANADFIYDISDIYIGADFDLSHTTLAPDRSWSNKGHQFYVGGIIGRARAASFANQVPKNTIFSGSIDAPLALVSPFIAASRNHSDASLSTYAGLQYTYAGDFVGKAKGAASYADYTGVYYTGYSVMDYSSGSPELRGINADNDASHLVVNTKFGTAATANNNTRTFAEQKSFTLGKDVTAKQMAMFQGVNRGEYASEAAEAASAFAHPGYNWDFAGAKREMAAAVPVNFTITQSGPFSFKAHYVTARPAATAYSIHWYKAEGGKLVEITDPSLIESHGATSTLHTVVGEENIYAFLFDNGKVVESCSLRSDNVIDIELTDNGFPAPYTYTVTFKSNGVTVPFEVVNLKVELMRKSNMSQVKLWTSENRSSFTTDVPLTTYQTVMRVSVRSYETNIKGEFVKDIEIPKWLKISQSVTSNVSTNANFRNLPTLVSVAMTDNANNPVSIDGVNYYWTVNSGTTVKGRGETGQTNSTCAFELPISIGTFGKTLYLHAEHPDFLTDFTVINGGYVAGYMSPYSYTTGEGVFVQGSTMESTTAPGDAALTCKTVFYDNYAQPLGSLYGLDMNFILKDKSGETKTFANLTGDIVHTVELDGDNAYKFTFPYPYLGDLYFRMIIYDKYGNDYTTKCNFDNFNFKTIPTLEAVAGMPNKYAITLATADGTEHNVAAGLSFSWKVIDNRTGKEIPAADQIDIDASGMAATFKFETNYERKLVCVVKDYYDNEVTVSEDYAGVAFSIINDPAGSNTYRFDNEGSAEVPAGYTLTAWGIHDIAGNVKDISHLAASIPADKRSITVDDAVTERVLQLTATDPAGRPIRASAYLPTMDYGIATDADGNYMAQLNGTTDLSGFSTLAYSWDIKYDGGESQTHTPSTLRPATDLDYPGFNATILLRITDKYGTVSQAVRYIADGRTLDVTRSGTTLSATVNGAAPAGGAWKWYGISGDIVDGVSGYELASATSELEIDRTNDQYNNYYAVWTDDANATRLIGFYSTRPIIYVFDKAQTLAWPEYDRIAHTYPDGNDANNGRTPNTAVKTMARAYSMLDPETTDEDNTIVIMGYRQDADYLKMTAQFMPKEAYKKNATIIGTYGEIVETGALYMGNTVDDPSNNLGLGGLTTFRDIIFAGDPDDTGKGALLYLYCNLYDLTISNNVKVRGYRKFNENKSGLGNYKAPEITIVGAYHNYDNESIEYPKLNKNKDRTTIKIQSGNWGRVIAGARNHYNTSTSTAEADRYNHKSHNIFGHPQWPHRVNVEIAIKHLKGMDDYVIGEAEPFKYDIGLLVGGQTDGTIYTDSRLYMACGSVGRFISGNISYCRPVGDLHPADGFFGSTELTLEDGEIGELVGGTLGRNEGIAVSTETCDAYFYGRSIININGGRIHGNVYGAGAGGVVGVGDDAHHTLDAKIPYLTGNKDADGWDEVLYAPYATAKGRLPKMRLHKADEKLDIDDEDPSKARTILDLNKSYVEVNINNGEINGSVFGGGYGFSAQVNVDRALSQAGNVYGHTYVNMQGGRVYGSIYGGSAGSGTYYDKAPEADKPKFSNLANVYGETHVEISGGIVEGSVYGGAMGVAKLPNIATVVGSTHLNITQVKENDNTWRIPLINTDVYGGSRLANIIGNTYVTIAGGAFGRNIYGGSEGKYTTSADPENSLAVITGDTRLDITDGSFFTDDDANRISGDNMIAGSDRTFNIYGGGNINCVVDGDTYVTASQSLFASHKNLLEKHLYPTFADCLADETYRKFSIYGAGRGAMTDVTGDTHLDIHIVGGASVPSAMPYDVANRQQYLMIAGGGFSGNVYGNTNVKLSGNVFARDAFGGSMYGRVEGAANMAITGGSFYDVYGGGLLGDIMKGSNLELGTKAAPGAEEAAAAANRNLFVYGNVYGGNDVGGIVGYQRSDKGWKSNKGNSYNIRVYHDGTTTTYPYTYHLGSEDYGVILRIYGGNFLGDVFGAGNGDHTGYYVPNKAISEHHGSGFNRVQHTDGPAYLYHLDSTDPETAGRDMIDNDADKQNYGLYAYRPRTNRVRMHIGGNSLTDRVSIGGSVYGGGNSCTIGRFDPERNVFNDPNRFIGGGSLKVNFGSHVTVAKGVYMGNCGSIIGKQTVTDGSESTDKILESDYDYHYYDADTKKYRLGFPNTVDGRNRFHAYLKLADMNASTQLTFFDDPGTTDGNGSYDIKEVDMDTPDGEALAASDVRFGGFYAGGARGSITRHTDQGHIYHYILPQGLTIETRVVGGSDDGIIKFYKYASDYMSYDIDQPMFTYYGGVVYDKNYGGGGVVQWHSAPEDTDPKELVVGNETPRGERVVVKLDVRCEFDPRMSSYIDDDGNEVPMRYGGLVYGGCYNSGITNGSTEVICSGNLLGSYYESDNFRDYLAWSTLRHNIGRVYGGGFGQESSVRGRTNVKLTGMFRGFNVFGGGMRGDVSRGTTITVNGLAKVYNAIYGGGMHGNIGLDPISGLVHEDNIGANIHLISGGIDRVYGGAFMGDVHGGAHITISDVDQPDGTPRLLVGSVYGGNDVSGVVYPDETTDWCTDIYVNEAPRADKKSHNMSHESAPGSGLYYSGYPMVGTIYGAGNGNMADYIQGVTIDREANEYSGGKIHIANGNQASIDIWDLGMLRYKLPDVESARIQIKGGTIVNVYGGGSMCTVTGRNLIDINYADTVARAAFKAGTSDPLTWGVLRLFEDLQHDEITEDIGNNTRFSHQIYRVFGGNNLMDMSIQPGWNLVRGNIFSIYSGGNFGRMTYPGGLTLTIDAPDLRAASVYGGGRVGDIDATDEYGNRIVFPADKYGATLNIKNGFLGDVYGGNNVAGNVYNGANVNISGAVSGNVYGAGNGNYIYLYDYDSSHATLGEETRITEGYDRGFGGRYFILPPKEAYPGKIYGNTPEEKIVAINQYRPNVEKSYLNIEGQEGRTVFVLGNVFCGGNSSTVLYNPALAEGSIKMRVGSNVAIGGVFLGSNGESLANPYNIAYLANINDISAFADENCIETRPGLAEENKEKLHFRDQGAYDKRIYPNLISLYMRAAEVTAMPELTLPDDAVEAYIGNFTIGGNYGSMMSDETINLTLPASLTIMGRIVGGCYNSHLEYHGALSDGGMPKPLKAGLTDRLNLTVKSKFRPWRILYDKDSHKVSLADNITDADGNYVKAADMTDDGTYYYPEGIGNIFGGCFTSGKTLGNINIDVYTDELGMYPAPAPAPAPAARALSTGLKADVDIKTMMNNVAERRTVFAVIGAGYGSNSEVIGDTRIRLLPQPTTGDATTHPTVCTIFGGSHNGTHIGTSTTEVRDGMVFSSLYAGSRAALKYGSSEVIIGYPGYYRCEKDGVYFLKRADQISHVAKAGADPSGKYTNPATGQTYNALNADKSQVIKQTVRYSKGDIVAANVVGEIVGYGLKETDTPAAIDDMDEYFSFHRDTPADLGTKWDNIDINIGDNRRMLDPSAPYYGGGGIYGGGHALNASAMSFSGVNTQLAYTAESNRDGAASSPSVGFGGNSTIIVGDNPANTAVDADGKIRYASAGPDGEAIKDHISIGTAHYVAANLDPEYGDKISHYVRKVDADGNVTYQHQPSGKPVAGETYYKIESDGGIYGDGRRTFVEKFRAVDIEGYGYAGSTPQNSKLINTFQRMDLLSLTDCCLQLQGATDYATNSVDATLYAVARVGELRLNSSLKGDLTPSADDTELVGNLMLDTPRTRNFMGFFHSVHYLGAIASTTPMDPEAGDKHNEGLYRGPDGKQVAGKSYRKAKAERILSYESIKDSDTPEQKREKTAAFKQRNVATAPNMIGINNGYTLKVQNVFTTPASGVEDGILKLEAQDNIYYGPIQGVVEVKLLTLSADEGGGYIYAFNSHSDDPTDPEFLEASGNFVYPAAIDASTDNYIVDDCYPASYYANHAYKDSEECHYWYVTGHNYYFNATLTGYTFNGPKIDFRLNNADNLIVLSGVETSLKETIEIESIYWENHADPDYKSALTNDLDPADDVDSRSNYQLFLTIDKNTDNSYNLTDVGHAYVAQIPNGNGADAYGTDGGKIRVSNNYTDYGVDVPNAPTLGIRLHDTDANNQLPAFFHSHLEDPEYVIIKLKAKDAEGQDNFYTVRLNIVYLQGPYVAGKITIENCALPGEYIYANTTDVTVEMDESLTVTDKRWYLYPIEKKDADSDVYSWDDSPSGRVDVSRFLMDNISGDINRVELPARYYQNQWKVGYSIVVNGQDFPLPEPDAKHPSNLITVHNYHRMSTVAKSIKEMTQRHYATAPFDKDPAVVDETIYGFDIDLDLVGGALVYIEDDEDFAVFTKYVNYCNEVRRDASGQVVNHTEDGKEVATLVAEVLPGYNANGYITGFTNGKTIQGYTDSQDVEYRNVKNPSGAQNIRFVLTADVTTNSECMPITEFRGQFNGNGHNIHFNDYFKGSNFIDVNYGEIRDVGFISNGGEDEPGKATSVIKVNKGQVRNCYYFNFPAGHPETATNYSADNYAILIGENAEETTDKTKYAGMADNCYQNTNRKNADALAGVRYRNTQAFHNGLVAYNLNQLYLKARHNSRDNDELVRVTTLNPDHDPRVIPIDYLYNYYADGEYRYAYTYSVDEHPEGMRLPDNFGVPNYENYMGNGKSMHFIDGTHLHDDRRWFKVAGAEILQRDEHCQVIYNEDGTPMITDEGYFPIYIYDADGAIAPHSDFIFFGQMLCNDDERDYYPKHISYDNRVYRSSGFYGSDTDFAFHFNRKITAMQADLTAIDFTGERDLADPGIADTPQYLDGWQFYTVGDAKHTDNTYYRMDDTSEYKDYVTMSENAHLKQMVFYPPVMDLPGGDNSGYLSNIVSFDVVSNEDIKHHDKITKNLLVYTPAVGTGIEEISEEDNNRLFSALHYTRMQQWGDVAGETPQDKIIGHQLYLVSHASKPEYHFHAANGLFHLVDEQNFNAPIQFYIAHYDDNSSTHGRAWMLRSPKRYSSMIDSDDPDVFTVSKDGWESIALPFTCNRLVAVNGSDYIEKYSRGQITHFYGSDEKYGLAHHDYWLRGLVQTAKDGYDGDDVIASADFARPGKSTASEKLFEIYDENGEDQQKRGDYTYYNDWFYNSFKDLAYNENHNEYGEPMTFEQYCYLTKNAPYIIAFPGEDYYEFDLSGNFYNQMHETNGCHPQEILYEFTVDEIDANNNLDLEERNVRIPVTDDYNSVRHTKVVGDDGTVTQHHATFMLISGEQIADNMYVLNTEAVTAGVAGTSITLPAGSAFINCRDFGIKEILPFRTYLTVDLPGGASRGDSRFISVGKLKGPAAPADDEEEEEPQDEPQEPEDEIDHVLNIWVEGNTLMVETTDETQLDIVNMMGQVVKVINAYPGTNRYSGLRSGFYIVGRQKVYIP